MIHPLLSGLNPEQAEAASTTEGPLLVLAGAGSGKTRVLTHRIAFLIEQGVKPWSILAVTFTNKAAGEMKERVGRLVGEHAGRVRVSTFHSFCVTVLRRDIASLGYNPRFTIYDIDDQKRLLKKLMEQERIDMKRWTPGRVLHAIDQAKNRMVGPEDYDEHFETSAGDPTARIYPLYEQHLRAASAVDFNDLINLVVRLWERHPEVLSWYQHRFQYLLVDEYQDTNRAQFQLIRLLGARRRNVMVVGDDDQSIYKFRGADVRNILEFEKVFQDAKVVRLEQNYRSTSNILDAANAVVRNNRHRMEKTLWTDRGRGELIQVIVGDDEKDEARQVMEAVLRIVGRGRRWGEIAIIYRTNAASRAFEEAFVRADIPHALVGSVKFYERKEVKDLVSYLKLVLNPADDMAFERVINVPPRGIGPKGMDEIRQEAAARGVPLLEAARSWARSSGRGRKGAADFVAIIDRLVHLAREISPGELVQAAMKESGYLDMLKAEGSDEAQGRLDNLDELALAVGRAVDEVAAMADALAEGEDPFEVHLDEDPLKRLQAFLDKASLSSQADELPDEDGRGRVTLLTAHLAKGLEFPFVFVAGMNQGGFPHFMSMDSEEDLEEERRLVYVAFTRAMEQLTLCRPRRRFNLHSRSFEPTEPSRFLSEIPGELVEWGRVPGSRPQDHRQERLQRLGFTDVGGRLVATGTAPRRPWQEPTRGPSSSVSSVAPRTPAPPPARAPSGAYRTRLPESAEDFAPGTRVLHPQLGAGEIRLTSGSPSNLKVVVQFDSGARKSLMARFANLEVIDG